MARNRTPARPLGSRLLVAALASLVTLTATTTAPAASPLRWQFTEGEKLDYAVLQQLEMLINFNGAKMNVDAKQIFDISWDVGAVAPDGTASIGQKVTRMQVVTDSPFTGKVVIDSKKIQDGAELPPGPIGEMAKGMIDMLIGQEFKLTVGANGEVSKIELPEKLAARLANEGGQRRGGRNQMAALFGGGMSADAVEQLIRRVVLRLPDNGQADDSAQWKQQFVEKLGPLGTKTSNISYKYAGKEDNLDRIDVGTEVLLELGDDDSANVDMEIQDQDSEGQCLFDCQAGRLVSSKVVEHLVMEGIIGDNEMVRDSTSTLRVIQGGSENLGLDIDKDEKKTDEKGDGDKADADESDDS